MCEAFGAPMITWQLSPRALLQGLLGRLSMKHCTSIRGALRVCTGFRDAWGLLVGARMRLTGTSLLPNA